MFVKEVRPRLIKNSRGEKTFEVELTTYSGKFFCSAPSGKSRGKNEVEPFNYRGIGASFKLLKVFCRKLEGKNIMIKNLGEIKQLVKLIKIFESRHGRLGRSATYALEGVFLKAVAKDNHVPLWKFVFESVNKTREVKMPRPVGNCVGGGLHSKERWGKKPDFQEFLLIPKEKTFCKAVSVNVRAYHYVSSVLKTSKANDEGALKTSKTNEEVLEVLDDVSQRFGLRIGLDVAASSFFHKGYYMYRNKNLIRDRSDQSDYISRLIKKFGLFYVEDGMYETDYSGFKEILSGIKVGKTLIVGDDLTTTNIRQLRRAYSAGSINAVIIKPNQIGSILDVMEVVMFCQKNGIKMVFSHRSGETMDDILADYCVGFGGDFIKCGIMGRERLIKLRRVMEIERALSL